MTKKKPTLIKKFSKKNMKLLKYPEKFNLEKFAHISGNLQESQKNLEKFQINSIFSFCFECSMILVLTYLYLYISLAKTKKPLLPTNSVI